MTRVLISWRAAGRRVVAATMLVLATGSLVPASAAVDIFSKAPSSSASASLPAASPSTITKLRGWLGAGPTAADLLPPDEAFGLTVRRTSADTLVATLSPADGYYLYRDRITFRIEQPAGVTVARVTLPAGDFKDDPTFGKTEVYHHPIDAVLQLSGPVEAAAALRLHTSYQGCNQALGVCYPPIEKTVAVAAGAVAGSVTSSNPTRANLQLGDAQADTSEAGVVRRLFDQAGTWGLLAAFFGFGLLLAFSPCMLPMLPILSGLIAGRGTAPGRWQAGALSAAYVLGMALTYAAAGVAAGLAGSLLSAALQSPWVLGPFAALFVLLALSMFGLFELQLPVALQTAAASAAARMPGGRAGGVFLMGAVSALIVGPCVAAPLAGALLYIGQTRDALTGGTALFAMGLGMGVPLIVAGSAAGALLRRAGPWSGAVRGAFGVLMLATAIYLVSPVIPLVLQQWAWAALLIVSAMFVHAIDPLPAAAPGHRRLLKGAGVLALVAGIAMAAGALSGSGELLQPLAPLRSRDGPARAPALAFQPIRGSADLDRQLAAANGHYVMLDFWAEWCVSCKEMDRFTFSDPQVQARLQTVQLLRADVTANSASDQALLRRFSLFGPPGIVFFDPQGRELPYRVIGFEAPAKFLASLRHVLPTGNAAPEPPS
jgi:thiol:disulfide interchange protein DsbD